jgi:hypothetical protein
VRKAELRKKVCMKIKDTCAPINDFRHILSLIYHDTSFEIRVLFHSTPRYIGSDESWVFEVLMKLAFPSLDQVVQRVDVNGVLRAAADTFLHGWVAGQKERSQHGDPDWYVYSLAYARRRAAEYCAASAPDARVGLASLSIRYDSVDANAQNAPREEA